MDGEVEKSEVVSERADRVAWLKEAVDAGNYFVPAELLARSLLRRLGLDLLGLQHQ